jgi:hypothetical protein
MNARVFHFVAHTRGSFCSLCEPACARWTWEHVRQVVPAALACALMPDHLHVAAETDDERAASQRLARVLGHVGRNFDMPGFSGVEATPVRNAGILARTVRYIVRNACSDELVADPLAWPWTTHRDVLGAVHDPWVEPDRLAIALEQPVAGFIAAHHRYVTQDRASAPNGTVLPVAARPLGAPHHALPDFARAAASALRATPADIQKPGAVRHLFVQLAVTTGWNHPRSLALACRAGRTTIWRLSTEPSPALCAGMLCLGDQRLHQHRATPPANGRWGTKRSELWP